MKHFHISNRLAMRKYRTSVSISSCYYGVHLNTLSLAYLLDKFHTKCDETRAKCPDTSVFTSSLQFIPLRRDILVAINVLPLNITFMYCLYHACYMFRSFSRTAIRNTQYIPKTQARTKLKIINLLAHRF
jgi:hypothetical protein